VGVCGKEGHLTFRIAKIGAVRTGLDERKMTTTIRHALLRAICLMLRSAMTIFSMVTVFVGVRASQS